MISIEYYLRQRAKVEQQLFQELKDRLNGVCCRENCNSKKTCKPGCKPRSTCLRADKGLFVDVDTFQLHSVLIPNDVKSRYLSQVIEEANKEKENSVQQEKVWEYYLFLFHSSVLMVSLLLGGGKGTLEGEGTKKDKKASHKAPVTRLQFLLQLVSRKKLLQVVCFSRLTCPSSFHFFFFLLHEYRRTGFYFLY